MIYRVSNIEYTTCLRKNVTLPVIWQKYARARHLDK